MYNFHFRRELDLLKEWAKTHETETMSKIVNYRQVRQDRRNKHEDLIYRLIGSRQFTDCNGPFKFYSFYIRLSASDRREWRNSLRRGIVPEYSGTWYSIADASTVLR